MVDVKRAVSLEQPLIQVIGAERIVRSRLLMPETPVFVIALPEISIRRLELDEANLVASRHRPIISQP
jgi:hypothetical protein